jgi:pyrimidine-nucleoside phosphorylase
VELATTVAGEMLRLGDIATTAEEGREMSTDGLRLGIGLAKLREIVQAQGGDPSTVDDPSRLPAAPLILDVTSMENGYVVDVEPMGLALAANRLGAGRVQKGDPVDHAVGLELHRAIGDEVQIGDVLAAVHARTEAQAVEAVAAVRAVLTIGAAPPVSRPLMLDRRSTER